MADNNLTHSNHFKENNLEDNSDIDILIKQVANNEGYTSYEIDKKKVSNDGENFLGTLYEVDIKGNTKSGSKTTDLFIKKILPYCKRIDFGGSHEDLYSSEDYFYRKIVKELQTLEEDAGLPDEERLKFPKFYDESSKGIIILENLKKKGFDNVKHMAFIPMSFLEASIEQLAKFHALSFVYKIKRPEFFEHILKNIHFPVKNDQTFINFMKKVVESSLLHVREEYREKAQKFVSTCFSLSLQYYRDSTSSCCICHGDYKSSNIMYSGSEERVSYVVPVDFQLIHYGCPLIDFIFFVYLSTDFHYRVQHMDSMKNLYYTTLEQHLKRFKVDVNLMMSRTLFEEKFKKFRICGLIFFIQAGTFQFSEEGENIDLEAMTKRKIVISDKYTDRINNTMKEFIDLGYL